MPDTPLAEDRAANLLVKENRARRRWLSLLRLTLAIVLLATVLAWNDNGSRALGLLRRIAPSSLAVLLLLSLAANWISMLKWRQILRERGSTLPRMRLMRLYLVGKFFSNIAPSVIGGDVVRIVMLGRETGSGSRAAASVLIERFTGLATLVVLTIATAATSTRSSHQPLVATTILCASLGCGLAFLLAMSGSARIWCLAAARKLPWLRGAATWLASLHAELTLFARPGRMLAGAFLYSLAFYVLCSVSVYVAGRAVDFDASYAAAAQATPALYLVAAIPVSTSNFGWWEWCFSVLLQDIGARPEQGLAVGLMLRVVTMAVSLIGGAWLLKQPVPGTRISSNTEPPGTDR